MNADIISVLCPHLDLRCLYSLAAAYPQWASLIFRHLTKKMPCVQLTVVIDQECELLWRVGKLYGNGSNNVEYYQDAMEKLPKSVWMHLPFELMNVTDLDIRQRISPLPEEMYLVLAKITTPMLHLEFRSGSDARRVLEAISFQSGSIVRINTSWNVKDEELILPWDRLANCSRLERYGYMVSLFKELLGALESDHNLLHMKDSMSLPVACWVAKVVEAYLDKQGDQVRCLRRGAAGYEFVTRRCGHRRSLLKAGKEDAITHSDVRRHINIFDYGSNANLIFSDMWIGFLVKNIQRIDLEK